MPEPYEWRDERNRPDDATDRDVRREPPRPPEPPRRADRPQQYYEDDYGDPGGRFDRYERSGSGFDRRSMEAGAQRLREGIERGWRRLQHGVRRTFEEERQPYERDPRRGGGMFGGEDRRESLFSHDDGLGGRRLGSNRGKGPSGYIRSDSRILEDVSDLLTDDDQLDASDIEVKVEAGEVTLNGHVASREDKRRAEDLAEQASGVKHLQNNLRVKPRERPAEQSANPAATGGQNATAAAASGTMGSAGGAAPEPNPRPN